MSLVETKKPQPFVKDKIYGHADRVEEWLRSGQSRPITVELDLTNICNQKCPHCFGYAPERDQARMHLEEAMRIISQIREAGGRGITFTGGGDPTVSPICFECVRFARSIGLDIGFITNAQNLSEEKARVLIDHCQWVRVSVDAATPDIFRLTHGMGEREFQKVLDNVRMLVRLRRELRSQTTIGIGFLTSSATKGDIYAFAALGRELGVDYAQYRPLLRRHGEADLDYSDEEILSEMSRAASLATDSYQVVHSEHKYERIQRGDVGRDYEKCYGQHFAAVVAADRKMYVCCHMRGVEKYCIGDLSTNSVSEIWQSERRQKVAESVDFRDCPPLCRCDSFNSILWDVKENGARMDPAPEPKKHPNFI